MNKAFAFLKSLDWKIWLAIIIVVVLIVILIVINNKNKQPVVTTSTTVVNQPSNPNSSGNDSFPLKYGSRGANVSKWQTYLNSKGANLKIDGIWGPLTDAASLKYSGFNSITQEYFNAVIK